MSMPHDTYVDATAALVGLTIAPEYRDGVIGYFGIAADMAALVMQMPLGFDDEIASVFIPVEPPAP